MSSCSTQQRFNKISVTQEPSAGLQGGPQGHPRRDPPQELAPSNRGRLNLLEEFVNVPRAPPGGAARRVMGSAGGRAGGGVSGMHAQDATQLFPLNIQ